MLSLWYSDLYTNGLDEEARFPRERYRRVRAGLRYAEECGKIEFREAGPLALEPVLRIHDREYVERFLGGNLSEREQRRIGLRPWKREIVERTLVLTNGTVEATREAIESGGIAGNVGGGTHHAYENFGSGYCIFNDLAIAAREAQETLGVGSVLILDLDVHQGDGTAAIFEGDPTVRTVSLHCGTNFPFRKMRSDRDVSLAEGMDDDAYLCILERVLAEEARIQQWDLILFQAGVDVLVTDRLGHLALSEEGVRERNKKVFAFAAAVDAPLVVTMGGGYGMPLDTSVRAHCNLFEDAALNSLPAGIQEDRN
ncbi:MAG: histone deacetylase [Verrucomicrobiota bacterium]